MRKLVSVVSMILALTAVGVLGNHSDAPVVGSALETTLKDEVIYGENFENYNLDTTGGEIYGLQKEKFMWFNDSLASTKVIENDGSKAIQYTMVNTADYCHVGGLGTGEGNNFAKLVVGERYTLSMDVKVNSANPKAGFYIEYQNALWVGVEVYADGTFTNLNASATFDATYVDGHLTYSFIAGLKDGGNSYVKLTTHSLSANDTINVDNIKITQDAAKTVYSFDFDNYEVGTAATTSSSNIGNVWNGGFDKVEIASDGTNKYLKATSASKNGDAWPLFYINNLWNMKSGTAYRMTFDVLANNSAEFYLGYNAGYPKPCATYNSTSYVGKTADQKYILDGSFDGTHLTFDFVPNTDITTGNDWAQVAIIIKHNADVEFAIDNVKVYKLSTVSKSFELDTSKVSLNYNINDELDLSGITGNLTRADGSIRVIRNDEIVVDTTSVNMAAAGTYTVKAYIIDDYGVKFEQELTITVTDNLANAKALIADVTAIDTCTEYEQYDALKARYDALSEEEKAYFDAAVLDAKTGMLVKDKLAYMGTLCETKAKEANTSSNLLSSLNSYSGTNMILLVGILGLALIAVYYAYNRKRLAK